MGVGQATFKLDTLWPSLWSNGGNERAFQRTYFSAHEVQRQGGRENPHDYG